MILYNLVVILALISIIMNFIHQVFPICAVMW